MINRTHLGTVSVWRAITTLCILAIGLTSTLQIRAQQPGQMPCSMSQKQMHEMNKRGDMEMGFNHLKTTHHFTLSSDGGVIQVEANKAEDTQSRDQIRQHLRHIAMLFAEGNFTTPMIVHAKTPPGTEVMHQLKAEISYDFKQIPRGALIRISTTNPNALQAIHDFLRFQINEHRTGDSLEFSR